MRQSDFTWVSFQQDFNSATTNASRGFKIDGTPVGVGYLLIQQFDVEADTHRILINGKPLDGFDLARDKTDRVWTTWMDGIPPGVLKRGSNKISILRDAQASEFFRIGSVAIHWRENG
ncbi:hypothetical protein [uncultured Roseobacter sp.]|uniref:DUF7383 domain-containing protein n=1 Tax=uncultured Roseobacter sp. TaxID=114847 RepID=UPI00262AFE3D|nr:hypothetical protein [uncultured Roseobacter sp.]